MTTLTYSDYQAQFTSEKLGLVVLEASKRIVGWTASPIAGTYQVSFTDSPVITSIKSDGTTLAVGGSATSLSGNSYYFDRANRVLYLRLSSNGNPNGVFVACTFQLFFSNANVKASHDLANGFEVDWLPLLKNTSQFGVELDNQNLLGVAIEGSGSVDFHNDPSFWSPIFDKYTFQNKRCLIYSWNRSLPISEAKLIYRGTIQRKNYTPSSISFGLQDLLHALRAPVPLPNLGELTGVKIQPSDENTKQRIIYGYAYGVRPQNIDQPLELSGYPATGTVAVSNGSVTVTGTGTVFLSEVEPNDELHIDGKSYAVKSVDSDSQVTLTENYSGASGSFSFSVRSSQPKRNQNRIFKIASHALREPSTTVVQSASLTITTVADATDFLPGDSVLANGEVLVIRSVSGNSIRFTTATATPLSAGVSIKVLPVRNVYLNNRLLSYSRDYTYSASDATITLTSSAEFNIAPVLSLTGTLAFTSGSRAVTGTGTVLSKELKPGDWVRIASGYSDFFEVLAVDGDTNLTLKTAATYTASGAARYKSPDYYSEGRTVLAIDCLGATEDGTTSGVFIKTAPQAVKDLLIKAGLSSVIDNDSFALATTECDHRIGLVIPERFNDSDPKNTRDIISRLNKSVFGSLYQNSDFQLEYSVLSPKRPTGLDKINDSDALTWAVRSDMTNVVKTAIVRYRHKEHDSASDKPSFLTQQKTSDIANYLAQTQKEFIAETCLVDENSARIMATRWAFFLELGSSLLDVSSKMQLARAQINQKYEVNLSKVFERIGATQGRRILGVAAANKSISESQLSFDDLSNAFVRCATIAPNGIASYPSATEDEKFYHGFITDDYGMQDNDPETYGINLIW